MADFNAPWLDGLDGTSTWNAKPSSNTQHSRILPLTPHTDDGAAHDHTRKLARSQSSSSASSLRRMRSPLATLNANDTNTMRRAQDQSQLGSVKIAGTIQQRSKSSSPTKQQASMEWRRRLLDGKVGYGDQTDLFGPTGLENIFASTENVSQSEQKPGKSRFGWIPKSDMTMPSSPPPWPSKIPVKREEQALPKRQHDLADELGKDGEESHESKPPRSREASVVSNPFDLSLTESVDDNAQDPAANTIEVPGEVVHDTNLGITEMEQEDFSPVLVSKHRSENGTIDYAAIDSHTMKSLQGEMTKQERATSEPEHIEESAVSAGQDALSRAEQDSSVFTDGAEDSSQLPPQLDLSLSENLPTGTPEPFGRFVQVQRGGYADVGSFRHRPLSENASIVGGIPPVGVRDAMPPAPTPPTNSHLPKAMQDRQSLQVNSSPLKLFSNYDTFTNDRLLRRMSEMVTVTKRPTDSQISNSYEKELAQQDDMQVAESKKHVVNVESSSSTPDVQTSDRVESPTPKRSPETKTSSSYPLDTATSVSRRTTNTDTSAAINGVNKIIEQLNKGIQAIHSENKRPPASPLKHSAPKRQRTLHASEMPRRTVSGSSDTLPQKMPAVRQVTHQVHAHAQPDHTWPSDKLISDLQDATEDFLAHEDPSIVEEVIEQVELSFSDSDAATFRQRAEAVATEVANFTIKVNKDHDSHDAGERKRSVTTQDFFREAECVMEYIRARAAHKTSALTSVEEVGTQKSTADGNTLGVPKTTTRPSDHMRISREPSWEGRPRSRWREPEQSRIQRQELNVDRVASQLRKWQEPEANDDPDVFLENETEISGVLKEADDEQDMGRASSEIIYDQQAQIRITKPSSEYQFQNEDEGDSRPDSQRSAASTGSISHRSDNLGTLAPGAVAHLIGSEVGCMTFDKDKGAWVKLRPGDQRADKNGYLDVHASHVTSEDDPFREISDLVVDEGIERRRISSPARLSIAKPDQISDDKIKTHSKERSGTVTSELSYSNTVLKTADTADRNGSQTLQSETAAASHESKNTMATVSTGSIRADSQPHFQSAGAVADPLIKTSIASDIKVNRVIDTADLSAEASKQLHHLQENDSDGSGTRASAPEPAVLERFREESVLDDIEGLGIQSARLRQSLKADPRLAVSMQAETVTNPLTNKPDLLRQTYDARESSEVSIVAPLPGDRMLSLSLSVSKPLRSAGHVIKNSSPLRPNSTFLLSDLPDFTVHEQDEERPSERRLTERILQYATAEAGDRFALATKEVVKSLSELYSDEMYWEGLTQVELEKRALTTLHGLGTFCNAVTRLNVSSNQLQHLAGAPSSVQTLTARNNSLSDLTSFAEFTNLQHLDISGNKLTNLAALDSCVHLRTLVADDNEIESLDEISHLSILQLRCRRNKLTKLDVMAGGFEGLQDLDLAQNSITHVHGLEHLHNLRSLSLARNRLEAGLHGPLPAKLERLTLRGSELQNLDLSSAAKLQRVCLDDNKLTDVVGIETLRHLDWVSMRRQQLNAKEIVTVLRRPLRCRYLSLSGNTIPSLELAQGLDLSHLDLADAGIHELPSDFALNMRSLRSLNLQSNNLKDISLLRRMPNLHTIRLSSNRIARMRKTTAVLGSMPMLKRVDLRNNPVTEGFYNVTTGLRCRGETAEIVPYSKIEEAIEDDEAADRMIENERYMLPEADVEADERHTERFDEDTRIRRKVYEMLLAQGCKQLKQVDGLGFYQSRILKRDETWQKLLELGVVRKSE